MRPILALSAAHSGTMSQTLLRKYGTSTVAAVDSRAHRRSSFVDHTCDGRRAWLARDLLRMRVICYTSIDRNTEHRKHFHTHMRQCSLCACVFSSQSRGAVDISVKRRAVLSAIAVVLV